MSSNGNNCIECGGHGGNHYSGCSEEGVGGSTYGKGDWTLTATWVYLLLCFACPPLLILGVIIFTVLLIKDI